MILTGQIPCDLLISITILGNDGDFYLLPTMMDCGRLATSEKERSESLQLTVSCPGTFFVSSG